MKRELVTLWTCENARRAQLESCGYFPILWDWRAGKVIMERVSRAR